MPWSEAQQRAARTVASGSWPGRKAEPRVTLRDVLAALGLTSSPLDQLPREAQGVRPDYGMTGAGLGQARRHPGEYLPGEASQTDTANALWGIVESAGMENLPGIGPHKTEMQRPAAARRQVQLIEPTEYVYHGTNKERAAQIAEAGRIKTFKPNWGSDQDSWPDGSTARRAYFTSKQDVTGNFFPAEGEPVVLRVRKTAGMKTERYTGDIYSDESIPAKHVEMLMPDGSWVPLGGKK